MAVDVCLMSQATRLMAPAEDVLPVVSIAVPFGGYLIGSLLYIWLNQKKELQWRL